LPAVPRPLVIITDPADPRPRADTAIARALLDRVGAGLHPAALRLYTPGRIVAFGSRDAAHPRYPQAVAAASAAGFRPEERLAGGKAAVFHEGTIAFAWAIPELRPRETISARFDLLAGILVDALTALGVDARPGEVPGEYCPGSSSINARGAKKLVGVGQRLTASAAHLGGVIVVDRADLVNAALDPVYSALGYDWDPGATGAIADEVAAAHDAVRASVVEAFSHRFDLTSAPLDGATRQLAEQILPTIGPHRR
jgi:lipoate-protein ligase A